MVAIYPVFNSVKSDYASLQIMYICQSYHGILSLHAMSSVMLSWYAMFYILLGNQKSFL